MLSPKTEKLGEDIAAEINTDDKKMPTDQSALMVVGYDLLNPANDQVCFIWSSSVNKNLYSYEIFNVSSLSLIIFILIC